MKIKVLIIVGVPLLLALAIIAYFVVLPWAMITTEIFFLPYPLKPEIKYGEFPFRLEYEIDGQRKVIEDNLVCEYDGIGMNEGQGKYRKWNERLTSGNQNILLLSVDNSKEIYYNPGPADYYMDDMGGRSWISP